MRYRLSKENHLVGARSVPVGFGHFQDVEPGDEFEVFDPDLGANPTFTLTDVFEPVDNEAKAATRTALEQEAEDAIPEPAYYQNADADGNVAEGEPVEAVLLRQAAEARGVKITPKKAAALPADPVVIESGEVPGQLELPDPDEPAAPAEAKTRTRKATR